MIDKTLEGSRSILDKCLQSKNPCIEGKVQGAYGFKYFPIKEQHNKCKLAYIHIINDYTTRPTGVSEGTYPFWFGV